MNAKQRLLVVDDDANILRLVKKIFEKIYDVRIAKSPLDGLKILDEGFDPGVILSDQVMPVMNGSEFLGKATIKAPLAIKIILTGHTETQDIIRTVNEAKANQYLTKPFKEIELFQAVKVSFEQYKLRKINIEKEGANRQIIELIEDRERKVAKLSATLVGVKEQITDMFYKMGTSLERLTYIPHTDLVVKICKRLCTELDIRGEMMARIVSAAKMHNIYRGFMPEHIALIHPSDFTSKEEMNVWATGFQKSTSALRGSGVLEQELEIYSFLFENRIGTGMPSRTRSVSVPGNILSIANRYVSSTYSLLLEDYRQTNAVGPWEQTESETIQRHTETMTQISNTENWYDKKVHAAFISLAESASDPFTLPKNTLRIEY
ncbi:MAG: hypothetical protein Kapaf2KO_11120 [Candidatus Kapaibacteriales bacterium]